MPGAPPHDGIRLFLPAFGFWCVFAGIGAQRVFDLIATVRAVPWRFALRAALAAALLTSAVNLVRYYPANAVALQPHRGRSSGRRRERHGTGVLVGCARQRRPQVAQRAHRARRGPRLFSSVQRGPVTRLGQSCAHKLSDAETGRFKWYVLQNRPAMFTLVDRRLMDRERPAYVKYAGRRPSGTAVPRDLDVPLISVFSFDQYQRARRRVAR